MWRGAFRKEFADAHGLASGEKIRFYKHAVTFWSGCDDGR